MTASANRSKLTGAASTSLLLVARSRNMPRHSAAKSPNDGCSIRRLSGRAIIRTNDPLACRNQAKGDMQMTSDKKSTDPGLSNAERKALRGNEAREAMSDHEDTQKAFN